MSMSTITVLSYRLETDWSKEITREFKSLTEAIKEIFELCVINTNTRDIIGDVVIDDVQHSYRDICAMYDELLTV